MPSIRSISPSLPTTIHLPTNRPGGSGNASPSRSVPGSPRVTVHTTAGDGSNRTPRGVMTISSLYSTAQCVLSMVGSIGVILLFAGIPQLIYSPSVQLSNLMTFLLGASLITAMVAGNAFVNYKYRQYLHRNPVTRPPRRTSLEGRDDKPPPYEDIEKMDAQPPDYPSAVAGCPSGSESPPSYHWLARMYQWGNLIDTSASGSHCGQPSTSCDSGNGETPVAVAPTNSTSSSPSCRKSSTVQGEVNHSFQNNSCDPCDVHGFSRKTSSVSNPSTPSKLAPVLEKFKRGKPSASNGEENAVEDPKKSGLWTIRRHFLRSVSDEGFMSLPSHTNMPAGCSSDTPNSLHYCITNETVDEGGSSSAANVSGHVAPSSRSPTRRNSELSFNTNANSTNVDVNQVVSDDRYRTVEFTSVDLEPAEPLSRINFNALSPSALLTTYDPHWRASNASEETHTQSQQISRGSSHQRRKSEAGPSSGDADRACPRLGRRISSGEFQSISSRLGEASSTLTDELVRTHRPSNAYM